MRIPQKNEYDPDQVYQPEADSYLLLEVAMREIRPGDRVLEIGTGSGVVAAGLTGYGSLVVTDINPHAVVAAQERGLEVVRTNLADGLCGNFDLVLFNPPYLPTREEEKIDDWLEYALDGGPDGRSVIRQFAKGLGRLLTHQGRALVLISSLTGLDEVKTIFDDNCFISEVVSRRDVFDEELIVIRINSEGPRDPEQSP